MGTLARSSVQSWEQYLQVSEDSGWTNTLGTRPKAEVGVDTQLCFCALCACLLAHMLCVSGFYREENAQTRFVRLKLLLILCSDVGVYKKFQT